VLVLLRRLVLLGCLVQQLLGCLLLALRRLVTSCVLSCSCLQLLLLLAVCFKLCCRTGNFAECGITLPSAERQLLLLLLLLMLLLLLLLLLSVCVCV